MFIFLIYTVKNKKIDIFLFKKYLYLCNYNIKTYKLMSSIKEYNKQSISDYIIDRFSNFHELDRSDAIKLVNDWISLPEYIKNRYEDLMPYWLCSFLRQYDTKAWKIRLSNLGFNTSSISFNGLLHKTITFSTFNDDVWSNKKLYYDYCKEFHIYGKERDELWDEHIEMVDRLNKPLFLKNEEIEKLIIDDSMKSNFGWLSPNGTFIVCRYTEHLKIAKEICKKYGWENENDFNYEYTLNMKKWVKIHSSDDDGKIYFSHIKDLTTDQVNEIDRYCVIHKTKYINLFN
jgi:hypothetical protein